MQGTPGRPFCWQCAPGARERSHTAQSLYAHAHQLSLAVYPITRGGLNQL